ISGLMNAGWEGALGGAVQLRVGASEVLAAANARSGVQTSEATAHGGRCWTLPEGPGDTVRVRLLHVCDLHYELRQYDWLLGRAADYDAGGGAGAALSTAAPAPVEAQIVATRPTLAELARRTRVVLCSGNHDLDSLNGAGE